MVGGLHQERQLKVCDVICNLSIDHRRRKPIPLRIIGEEMAHTVGSTGKRLFHPYKVGTYVE